MEPEIRRKPEKERAQSAAEGVKDVARKKNKWERVEAREYKRLMEIYKTLPQNKLDVAEGLIRQAARLRARLDMLWEDLQANGETEAFTQSKDTEPYERERPASRTFTATDKSYQQIIKQLAEMCPEGAARDALNEFLADG